MTRDAALDLGITRFDAATGSYGGCPFAPGAHGNLATETLVAHLEERGVTTGIDLDRVHRAAELTRAVLAAAAPVQEHDAWSGAAPGKSQTLASSGESWLMTACVTSSVLSVPPRSGVCGPCRMTATTAALIAVAAAIARSSPRR